MSQQVISEKFICDALSDFRHSSIRYVVGSVNIPLGLLATVGNTVIIMSVLKSRHLRSLAPTYFIISLACADWLVGAVVQPLYAIMLFDWSTRTCNAEQYKLFLGFFTCSVSICSAMFVCFDRKLKICNPFKYDIYITNRTAKLSVLFTWICGGGIGYASVFINERKLMAFGTLAWVLNATAVGIYCSIKIYEVGRRQIKDIAQNYVGNGTDRYKKEILKERKLALSLVMVLAAILICWLPFVIINICISFMHTVQNWRIFFIVRLCAITFGYANSCVNIFIFSFKNKEIKKAIKTFLGLGKNKEKNEFHMDISQTFSTSTTTSRLDFSSSITSRRDLSNDGFKGYGSANHSAVLNDE